MTPNVSLQLTAATRIIGDAARLRSHLGVHHPAGESAAAELGRQIGTLHERIRTDAVANSLATCPQELPADLTAHLVAFAEAWARHGSRPQPSPGVRAAWDATIEEWASDPTLPLFARKAADNRGSVVTHASGRSVVPVDNSPAQWVYAHACSGIVLNRSEIRALLQEDQVPIAMVFKKAERAVATYHCALGKRGTATSGWKLGHLNPVGLGVASLETTPIATLQAHFRALMAPSNMFLIPLAWGGVAEIPEVIEAIRGVLGQPI